MPKPYKTEDGSFTLYDPVRDLHYSSTHGARTESNHVFVDGARLRAQPPPWTVVELGFGAAINFVETVKAFLEDDRPGQLHYHGVDHRPVDSGDLEFHDHPAADLARQVLTDTPASGDKTGDHPVSVSDSGAQLGEQTRSDKQITLHFYAIPWTELNLSNPNADAIFFDPFGPSATPDSWTLACFERARRFVANDGILATYSAAGHVKRKLARVGFYVASPPGPGRKREITIASPSRDPLAEHSIVEAPES